MLRRDTPYPDEGPRMFVRRHARSVAVDFCAAGLWSRRAASLVVALDAHIQRERRSASLWPATLARWHVAKWRASRRLRAGSPTTTAGRTATRVLGGFVSLRWHDAVTKARVARL